eukprot:1147186-Pelagomonas_calceolata.AAC.1
MNWFTACCLDQANAMNWITACLPAARTSDDYKPPPAAMPELVAFASAPFFYTTHFPCMASRAHAGRSVLHGAMTRI